MRFYHVKEQNHTQIKNNNGEMGDVLEEAIGSSTKHNEYPENIIYWHIAPRTYVPPRKEHEGNIVVRDGRNASLVESLERIVIKLISEQGWTFEEFKKWIYDIFQKCSSKAGVQREVNNVHEILDCDRKGIHKTISANLDFSQTNDTLEKNTRTSYLYGNGENEIKSFGSTTCDKNNDFFYVEERRRKLSNDSKYILEREVRRLENPRTEDGWFEKVNSTIKINDKPSEIRKVYAPVGKSLIEKQEECHAMPDLSNMRGKCSDISYHRGVHNGQGFGENMSHKSDKHESLNVFTKTPTLLENKISVARDNTELYQTPAQDIIGNKSNCNWRTTMASDIDERGRKVFRFIKRYNTPPMNHYQDTKIGSINNKNAKTLVCSDTFLNKKKIVNDNKAILLNNSLGKKENTEDSILQNQHYSVSRLLNSSKNFNPKPISLRLTDSLKGCEGGIAPEPVMYPKLAPTILDSNKVPSDDQQTGHQLLKTNPEFFIKYLEKLYPDEFDKIQRLRKECEKPSTNIQCNGRNQYNKDQIPEENKLLVKLQDPELKIQTNSQSLVRDPSGSSIEALWHSHKILKSRVKMFHNIKYLHHRRQRGFRARRYLRNSQPSRLLLGGRSMRQFPLAYYKENLPTEVNYRPRLKRVESFHSNIVEHQHNSLPLHLSSNNNSYNYPTRYVLLADKSVMDEVNPLPRTHLEIESGDEHFCVIL